MTPDVARSIICIVVVAGIVATVLYAGRGGARLGPGVGSAASGAIYDLLNEDKRKAIEIIVEQRAEARDPEDADGNLPDLAGQDQREPKAQRPRA